MSVLFKCLHLFWGSLTSSCPKRHLAPESSLTCCLFSYFWKCRYWPHDPERLRWAPDRGSLKSAPRFHGGPLITKRQNCKSPILSNTWRSNTFPSLYLNHFFIGDVQNSVPKLRVSPTFHMVSPLPEKNCASNCKSIIAIFMTHSIHSYCLVCDTVL